MKFKISFSWLKKIHWSKLWTDKKILSLFIILIIAILCISFASWRYFQFTQEQKPKTTITDNKDIYTEFLVEIFQKIKTNYWEVIKDEDLFKLYQLGTEKLKHPVTVTIGQDEKALRSLLTTALGEIPEEKDKKEYAVNLATIVLYNLQPAGRSGLFTVQKETELWNNVKNIDPGTNLYDEIGVKKGANTEEITKAAQMKEVAVNNLIKNATNEEEKNKAQEQLAKVTRAKETLSLESSRDNYNQYGIESTVIAEKISNNILHLWFKKISPSTYTELQQVTTHFDQFKSLNTLILDLRGNVGGSIDLLPYLLGPFIGENQYAYEFYHQGKYEPYKTKTGWLPSLVRYKKVVILQDDKSQSSAEMMTAVLKKYNIGVVVGTNTRGWGTIEAVFELTNQIDPKETYKNYPRLKDITDHPVCTDPGYKFSGGSSLQST
ncbi:MAG: hypothetical protein CO133_03025 [Candidatus Komeilibacteria bacterium CG_4_9_14_3_um_filter_37_5]|nr:MAG: hypothetical protein CO133_03025 [Candidatus Komeilibacteria bacterium CG_4_9_14_3_um_filter_37_5]